MTDKERYVVVTNTPYQWSSGPQASYFDELEGEWGAQAWADRYLARSGAPGTEEYISVAIGIVTILNPEYSDPA